MCAVCACGLGQGGGGGGGCGGGGHVLVLAKKRTDNIITSELRSSLD